MRGIDFPNPCDFALNRAAPRASVKTLKINDYLYFDGDFNALKRYILNGHPIDGKVKFFLGYSGWTEGQLNHEIKRNSWAVSHITTDNILSADGEGYWKDSVELLGNDYKTWTKYPKDPYLN